MGKRPFPWVFVRRCVQGGSTDIFEIPHTIIPGSQPRSRFPPAFPAAGLYPISGIWCIGCWTLLSLSNLPSFRRCNASPGKNPPIHRPQDDDMTPGSYPPVPLQTPYNSCYCEENIYHLATSFLAMPDFRESWDLSVVFISNATKTASLISYPPLAVAVSCSSLHRLMVVNTPMIYIPQVALWSQRAAGAQGSSIVWDYHVVLALRPRYSSQDDGDDGGSSHTASWIYDFDTTLNLPHDARGGFICFINYPFRLGDLSAGSCGPICPHLSNIIF